MVILMIVIIMMIIYMRIFVLSRGVTKAHHVRGRNAITRAARPISRSTQFCLGWGAVAELPLCGRVGQAPRFRRLRKGPLEARGRGRGESAPSSNADWSPRPEQPLLLALPLLFFFASALVVLFLAL